MTATKGTPASPRAPAPGPTPKALAGLFGDAELLGLVTEILGIDPPRRLGVPSFVSLEGSKGSAAGVRELPRAPSVARLDAPSRTIRDLAGNEDVLKLLERSFATMADPMGSVPPGTDVPLRPAAPTGWTQGASQGGPGWYGWGGDAHPASRRHIAAHMRSLLPAVPNDCNDVGVFVVDVGMSAAYLARPSSAVPGGTQLRGGLKLSGGDLNTQQPGRFADPYARQSDGHGNMVARNITSMAPSVALYDVPLLPEQVSDVAQFASVATLLMWAMWFVITADGKLGLPKHRHWIVVNAWAVADRFADVPGPFGYADNPDHPLNLMTSALAVLPNCDVVFAAGNNGELVPDPMSGLYDRGPHRSIWGANGLPGVHTVGAVTPGGRTIAASSQGPSLPALAGGHENRKPDLAASSWFHEEDDASVWNSGTSAAAALYAGWLACFRSSGQTHSVPDQAPDAAEWSPHAGNPILPRSDGTVGAGTV